VAKNKDQFKSNQEICSINNRYSSNLHLAMSNLATFQRGAFYSAIKLFSLLATSIKSSSNKNELFRSALKRLLISNSFYSIE